MDDIKNYWKQWLWRDALTKLITINFLVWLVCAVISTFGDNITEYLMLPGAPNVILTRPWTLITYMFAHYDFLHMFVNMLWLLLFGQIFLHMQGGRHLVTLYIYGGLAGAVAFIFYHISYGLVGASSAVFAIIGAVAVLYHQLRVNLLLFGEVKILWVAVAAVVLFVIMGNPDQMVTHCAGLAIGIVYALLKRKGIDITNIFARTHHKNFPPNVRRPFSTTSGYRTYATDEQELDNLLDKVNRSGYSSLSPSERQRLFELSNNMKGR